MNTSFYNGIKEILISARNKVYQTANFAMVEVYWNIGKRIIEQEQNGENRADTLSYELTAEYGTSYSKRNLQYFRKFYLLFPDEEIVNACVHNLSWTHFRSLLRVQDEEARLWYMKEVANEGWNYRTLDRNIGTQYYYRLLQAPKKEEVISEMKQKTNKYQKNKYELLKNLVIAEFLGFKNEDTYLENDLETAILNHIRDFLMEMGRRFASGAY